ncbi:MAG: hypothetical protein NT150_13070 [Bacteroidetes bacterium]|nr:hypothetical protein [Bacteroidota bacterium]
MKPKIFLIAFVFLFVNSCTIEKRIYNDGFHVQMKGNYKHVAQENKQAKTKKEDLKISKVALVNSVEEPESSSESLQLTPASYANPANNQGNLLQEHKATLMVAAASSNSNKKSEKDSSIENTLKSKSGDNVIYLSAIAMSLAVIALYKSRKKQLAKLTRWAKANPRKAQGLIATLQLGLSGLALYSGYNLRQLGFHLSSNANYLWLSLSAAGFLATPFLAKKANITLPKTLNFNRLKFLGITISSLMLLTNLGNTINTTHPTSFLAKTLSYADQSIVKPESKQSNTTTIDKTESQNKHTRLMLSAGMCVAAVLLTLVLLIPLCAGICLIYFGVAGLGAAATSGSIFMLLGGVLLTILSILGIRSSIKLCAKPSKE